MKVNIDELTEQELIELNHKIVERLKFLESYRSHKEMMNFAIGDKVSFQPSGRGRQLGILTKFNRKSVTVITENGERWNVSPHLLSKVKSVQDNKKDTDIFKFKGGKK